MKSGRLRVAHLGSLPCVERADGVTKTIEGLVTHLSEFGIDVEVWQFGDDIFARKEDWVNNIRVLQIPRLWKAVPTRAPKYRSKLIAPFAEGIDLLHLHSVFRSDNVCASHFGIPYVLTPNGGYLRGVIKGRRRLLKKIWIALWEKRIWSEAQFLHAVSECEAAELRRLPSAPAVVTVANGVRHGAIAEKRIPHSQRRDWISIGRLATRQKGLDLLLTGYAIANRSCPLPRLRIIGPDFRKELRGLKGLVQRLGIGAKIQFDGALFGSEKTSVLEHAALLVQCSRWEGMPFTVLEAMAAGTPVLVTPGTNLARAVSSADAGWTCEARAESVAQLLSAIARAAEAECDRRGTNAQCLVREQFTWKTLTSQMAAAYHRACDKPA
jgi:glycosyltransferase involved in cell wall biosynthesis